VGERDAVNPCASASQIDGETAPARADVEDGHTRFNQELCRNMPLLLCLSLLQGFRAVGEVGAGILAISIKEQVIEQAREVVVMCNIGTRPPDRIVLLEKTQWTAAFACSGA
jgi:hypothetical protein